MPVLRRYVRRRLGGPAFALGSSLFHLARHYTRLFPLTQPIFGAGGRGNKDRGAYASRSRSSLASMFWLTKHAFPKHVLCLASSSGFCRWYASSFCYLSLCAGDTKRPFPAKPAKRHLFCLLWITMAARGISLCDDFIARSRIILPIPCIYLPNVTAKRVVKFHCTCI